MASTAALLVLVVHACVLALGSWRGLAQASRPSYAGSTGGRWENYVGQRIPPGTPWPARAEDYTTIKKGILEDKTTESPVQQTTSNADTVSPIKDFSQSTTEVYVNIVDTLNQSSAIPNATLEHKPTSFAEQNVSIKTPNEIDAMISTTSEELTTQSSSSTKSGPSILLGNKPSRPSYAGLTGGTVENYVGQKIPSGTPWPVKVEDSSSTTEKSADAGSTISQSSSVTTSGPSIVLGNKPNRPSFAGLTGGTVESYVGQKVPSGTPWPAKVEDSSSTTEKSSNAGGIISQSSSAATPGSSIVLGNKPIRPSFAGSTGGIWENYVGQKVPSGTPFPEKLGGQQDYRPHQEIVASNDTVIKEDSLINIRNDTLPNVVLGPLPNNPPMVESQETAGHTVPSQGDKSDSTISAILFPTEHDGDVDSNTAKPSIVLEYKPNRPSFAGSTSGTWEGLVGQIVPSASENQTDESTEPNATTPSLSNLPYVYIALDREDIKAVIKSSLVQGFSNDSVRLLVLDLKLGNIRSTPENDNGKNQDPFIANEKFLATEKCNTTTDVTEDPVVSLLINVEGLKNAVRDAYLDTQAQGAKQ